CAPRGRRAGRRRGRAAPGGARRARGRPRPGPRGRDRRGPRRGAPRGDDAPASRAAPGGGRAAGRRPPGPGPPGPRPRPGRRWPGRCGPRTRPRARRPPPALRAAPIARRRHRFPARSARRTPRSPRRSGGPPLRGPRLVHAGPGVHRPRAARRRHRDPRDDDREGARHEDLPHVVRDVLEGLLHVRVDDVRVPAVDDPVVTALVLEVAPVLLDVVVAELRLGRPVPGVADRHLPDLSGREARARLPRRPLVGGRAGGDHAITYPVVRAYEERLNVVHFDAHLDYRPFVHGVQWANGNPIRNVSQLKTCHHIIQVGIRSLRTSQSDVQDSRARGNDIVTMPEFRRRGVTAIVDRLPANEPVYVSIDIDVLDLPLVPGCASSEPNGLSYEELRQTLFAIARGREVIGFDVVEVNPMLDVASDNTSLLAAQLTLEFLGRIVEHPGYRARHPMRARGAGQASGAGNRRRHPAGAAAATNSGPRRRVARAR